MSLVHCSRGHAPVLREAELPGYWKVACRSCGETSLAYSTRRKAVVSWNMADHRLPQDTPSAKARS